MKSFTRILFLATAVSGLALSSNSAWSAQNPALTTSVSLAQELSAVGSISPAYKYQSTDPFQLTGLSSSPDLDNSYMGAATLLASSDIYWYMDSSNYLYATASMGGAWKTYKATLSASYSATATVTLDEAISDGSAVGSPTRHLNIILTATGTPSALTQSALVAFLRGSTIKALAANSTGTALTSSSALTTGWTAKAYADNSGTAEAITLDPIDLTIALANTSSSGAGQAFTASISNIHTWNLATGSTTSKPLVFTASGGRYLTFNTYPGLYARTSGIASSLMTSLTNISPKRINQSAITPLNTLPSAVSEVSGLLASSPSGNVRSMLNTTAGKAIAGAYFTVADFTTKVSSNKYGLVAMTADDLASVTWTTSGSVITANAKVGSTGVLKNFTCDLSGLNVIKSTTNPVHRFSSTDGEAFWVKSFDTTGLDTSAVTTVSASDQDALLALQLQSILSAATTVAHMDLDSIVVASIS